MAKFMGSHPTAKALTVLSVVLAGTMALNELKKLFHDQGRPWPDQHRSGGDKS